jgi:hypothetical protein
MYVSATGTPVRDARAAGVFCHAILPRAGLGNRLLTWARCRVFSETFSVPMLRPTWAQLKVGPLLRGETDWRTYHNLFRSAPDEVSGLRRLGVLLSARRLREPEPWRALGGAETRPRVIVFRGFEPGFRPLIGWHELLHRELLAMTCPRWTRTVRRSAQIGIHVRRSDFAPATSPEDFQRRGALRTPIAWFLRTLRQMREAAGPVPAFVVSDGPSADVAELLAEPSVELCRAGSAVGDLLQLATARFLIGSGGSSFSAWAAFLAQAPVVTLPGGRLTWFGLQADSPLCAEYDPAAPSPEVLAQAKVVLA